MFQFFLVFSPVKEEIIHIKITSCLLKSTQIVSHDCGFLQNMATMLLSESALHLGCSMFAFGSSELGE